MNLHTLGSLYKGVWGGWGGGGGDGGRNTRADYAADAVDGPGDGGGHGQEGFSPGANSRPYRADLSLLWRRWNGGEVKGRGMGKKERGGVKKKVNEEVGGKTK